jgi:hypothetical protein
VYLEAFVMLIAVTDEIFLYRPAIWVWPSDGCVIPELTKETSHEIVANMASYAISSGLIFVIHDNMIIGTNHIVLACLCRHF